MKYDETLRLALAAALLPLIVAGCATQGSHGAAATKATAPVVSTPAPAPAAVVTPATPTGEAGGRAPRPAQALPPPTEVETQAGIQIVHIGATASGGLVDARFKVLDAAKATALLSNAANTPMLIAGDKPPLMAPHHAIRSGRVAKDQIIYILYPNTRSAVQPGTEVMVALGATRLGPVTAQ